MKLSAKINLLDKNVVLLNKDLRRQSEDAFANIHNNKQVQLIKRSLSIAIFLIITGVGLVTREFFKGDYPIYGDERIGAICKDGKISFSTGQGTCSHHGGVDYWRYPLVSYHYANPVPYYIIIGIAFSFLIVFTLINKAFRIRFIVIISETIYWSVVTVCGVLKFLYVLLLIPYFLVQFFLLLISKVKK